MRPSCFLTWLFIVFFAIPQLTAQTDRRCGGDQTIRVYRGAVDQITCGEAAGGVIEFRLSSFATPFVIVATDTENVIQAISWNNRIDFSQLGPGSFRVYGLFFKGRLLAQPGTDLDTDQLGGYCDGLTSNFISINTREPEAGMVTDLDGLGTQYVCPDDKEDVIAFANTGESGTYAYVITTTENVVLAIADSSSFDFNQIEQAESRVWGIAYTGMLSLEPGDTISSSTTLSTGCFDLSSNFLSVIQALPDAGTIQLTNGATGARLCPGQDGLFSFRSLDPAPTPFTFVLADAEGVILETLDSDQFDFATLTPGTYQVFGVSYTGNPSINAGDTLQQATLSDDCFDLSDTAVTITLDQVDGGQVSLDDGTRLREVCILDGESDQLIFVNNSTATDANYIYILTNEQDEVILPLIGDRIDFDVDLTTGINKVYGLSYTGEFLLESGQNVLSTVLADGCFDLSSTFITIIKSQVAGGQISLADSSLTASICPEGKTDTLRLITDGSSSENYSYVATSPDGTILAVSDTNELLISSVPVDTITVYGIAYSGNLTASPGNNVQDDALSDGCFALSENTVRITAERPFTGPVSLANGQLDTLICPTGATATITLIAPQATAGAQLTILTDTAGIVRAIGQNGSIELTPDLPQGDYQAWVATYSGTPLLTTGQPLMDAAVSDDCFAISTNTAAVRWESPTAGTLSFSGNGTSVLFCPQNNQPNLLSWEVSGNSIGNQVFLLTDTDNVIQQILTTAVLDGDTLAAGSYRIHNLAYTGTLTAQVGDTASTALLADGCFQLSTNFLQLDAVIPQGGTIQLSESNAVFCSGDGTPDVLKFAAEGTTPQANYTYLVADADGAFLFDLGDSSAYDFDQVLGGNLQVYGLSYTGDLTVSVGDTVTAATLSTDCFSLSQNSLTITRQEVDGGTVSTTDGRTTAYVCAGDGNPDILTFANDGQSVGSEYLYVITTNNNLVIASLNSNTQNFENVGGFPELRVWGISYTGNLTNQLSGNINDIVFSDGCYQLSDNFLTVIRDLPESGRITTTEGETDVIYCPGPDMGPLELTTSSTSNAGFVYLLTNTDSIVLQAQEETALQVEDLPTGDYLIWGVSYTGRWLINTGDTIGVNTTFSDDCFVPAQNRITLRKGGPVDGGQLISFFGDDLFYTCPGDTLGDIVAVSTPSDTLDAEYRLIITDENNLVQFPDVETTIIDFDRADPGIYRIYGVSFTGTFIPQFRQDLFGGMISSECYEPSENFIEVINFPPANSLVRTSDELTELTVDGMQDTLHFTQEGGRTVLPYRYILTDTDNQIISVLPDTTLLADTLANGTYRIWGLNHTGALLAAPGMQADADQLADNCYLLSDNFVSLTVDDSEAQPSAFAAKTRIQPIAVQPNPATDVVAVLFELFPSEGQQDIRLQVVSLTGEVVIDREIGVIPGDNRLELSIAPLENGMYLLRLTNGRIMQQGRFLKIQP